MREEPGYTIGRLAASTGCNVPTIRFYEQVGLLPPSARRPGGHRVFAERHVRRLTLIRRCRELGLPIEKVRAFVALAEDPKRDCFEVRAIAEAHLAAVRERLSDLRVLERNLARFAASCRVACAGGPGPDCAVLERLSAPRAVAARSARPKRLSARRRRVPA